jgi:hypothetical protein
MKFAALCAVIAFAAGCGTTVYQPSRAVRFDPATQITDDDIRVAFGARPQLERPARMAYFAFDDERADELERALAAVPGVERLYRIPPLLATGKRRFDAGHRGESEPLSVRHLRLHAARAGCDLLVVVDYGYRIERSPNALAALNVLVLPALFAPFVDAEVDSYMDVYLIDVRNGYLYGQIGSEETGRSRRMTIWSRSDRRRVEAQWTSLLSATRDTLAGLLAAPATEQVAGTPVAR